MPQRLIAVTPAAWLASDLARGPAVVEHSLGLWLPSSPHDAAWWCPGAFAWRLAASGIHPGFRTPLNADVPGWAWRRQVRVFPLREASWDGPVFGKPDQAKVTSVPAQVWPSVGDLVQACHAAGMGERSVVLLSEPVQFRAEFRAHVLDGAVASCTPYLIDGVTWDGMDPARLPDSADAARFAQQVADVMTGTVPTGWVLDVGMFEDGTWAVVETNPSWCANPYWATEDHAAEVVETILAGQGGIGPWWVGDPFLAARARPLT